MKSFLSFFLITLLSASVVYATHNRSGEITFEQISQYRYRVKILTYTKTSSPADRPYLGIRWGDNTRDSLTRSGETIYPNDIKRNEYEGYHTYPGPGTYRIFVEDPNRNAGVVNIPGSVGVNFYIETELQIDPYRGSFNNSPRLLQPPIDRGSLNKIFIHNPNAYDPDGDSLSYELIPCKGAGGKDIPGYIRLDNNPTYSNISCNLDPVTGDFIWNTPQREGEFNIAIRINEWRKDVKGNYKRIGFVIRDMQIEIADFINNSPPVLSGIKDTCVEAGTLLTFQVTGTDYAPNPASVLLFATGGPLELPVSPAQFSYTSGNPAIGTFTWQTRCENIRKQPYQVVFKAQDSLPEPLIDLRSMRITIVPPSPKNPVATATGNSVTLHWNPDICPQATGYKIYRKPDSTAFDPANCETGLPAYTGFVLIDEVTGYNDTLYTDNNKGAGLTPGSKYCYRIVANFPEGVESYTSVQVCVELKKDIPIMAQASVLTTDPANGTVRVAWTRPVVPDFDITRPENQGPYKFELYRAANVEGTNAVLIQTFNNSSFAALDTFHIDGPGLSSNTPELNTTQQHSYFVKFYTLGTNLKGTASPASTVLLDIKPTDNRLNLSWTFKVPWNNSSYNIYRKDNSTGIYTLIGSSTKTLYSDSGLANDTNYCYYVESIGALSGTGLPKDLRNNSQIRCEAAKDNIVPCPPKASAAADCEKFKINLTWDNPNMRCADDVLRYRVYFKKNPRGEWPATPIDSIDATGPYSATTFSFTHFDVKSLIPGCYSVTSVDSVYNEGPKSEPVCVECKPEYTLPNVFTPNNDGHNDLFRPFRDIRYIDRVDIKIFNRWGQLLFSSAPPHDPVVNWDGTYNGKECSEGTYYYVAEVYQIHLDGIVNKTIKGFVELLRGGVKSSNVQ